MKLKKIIILAIILILIIIGGAIIFDNFRISNHFAKEKEKCFDPVNQAKIAERQKLFIASQEAKTIYECRDIAKQAIQQNPICFPFNTATIGGFFTSRVDEGCICSDFSSDYVNYFSECIGRLASKNNNIEKCLNNEVTKEACDYQIEKYPQYWFDNQNCSIDFKQECIIDYLRLANPNNASVVDCDLFIEPKEIDGSPFYFYSQQSSCWYELALVENNSNLCLKAENNEEKCFTYLALRNNNSDICDGISFDLYKKQCHSLMNIIENNHSDFQEFKDTYKQREEAGKVENKIDGIIRSDVTIRSYDDYELKNFFAIYTKNSSLCSTIDYWGDIKSNICMRLSK